MDLFTLRCPNCNGEIEVEDGLEVMYCKYCGTKLMVDGMSDGVINAKVRLREMDHEERMHDKDIAFKKFKVLTKMGKENLGFFWMLAPMILLIALFGVLTCSHNSQLAKVEQAEQEMEEAIEKGDYDLARIKANQLRLEGSGISDDETRAWDEKREEYLKVIDKKIKERDGENSTSDDNKESGGGEEKPWWQFW